MGIRTPDPDLAKVVLYQLSYAPLVLGLRCELRYGGLERTRTSDLTLIRRVL
jgi:hypothetical protein